MTSGPHYLTAEEHAELLVEQQHLALEIADEAARTDIECYGREHSVDGRMWWFTQLPEANDPYDIAALTRAVRYLALRGRIEKHPDQPHLVRFSKS